MTIKLTCKSFLFDRSHFCQVNQDSTKIHAGFTRNESLLVVRKRRASRTCSSNYCMCIVSTQYGQVQYYVA